MAGILEELEFLRSRSSAVIGGGRTLEEPELWRSLRRIRCSGTLDTVDQTKAHEHMLSSTRKHVTKHLASAMAETLEELDLWRS